MTNRDARTRERSLIAVVAGTKSEYVIAVLRRIDEIKRLAVEEVTLDLSDSMRRIVRTAFPRTDRVIDRFHIQKLACDAVQELSIAGTLSGRPMMRWRRPNRKERTTFRSDTQTATHAKNCSSVRAVCYSNLPTNGLTDRSNGPQYCSRNIPTYRKHTGFAILYA